MQSAVTTKCKRSSNPTEGSINGKRLFKDVFFDMEVQDDACSAREDLMKTQLEEEFRCASWVSEDESKTFMSTEGGFALMEFDTEIDDWVYNCIENGCSIEIQYLLGVEGDNLGTLSLKGKEILFGENEDEENFSTELEAARVLKLCTFNAWHAGNHGGGGEVFTSTTEEDWFIQSLNGDSSVEC